MLDRSVEDMADEVGQLYPAVYRRFHVAGRVMPGADITARMLGVLQHLAAAGPLTLGELCGHLSLSKSTTTELVARLEQRELVDRLRDDADRRRVFVWLTATGRQRARTHPRVLADELLTKAVGRMRPADRDKLVKGLRALVAAGEELSDE